MKSRAERFGAWVLLDDGTLVAVDRPTAERLGVSGGAAWDESIAARPTLPLEVHVAVTSRCPVACAGCYQNASPSGRDVPFEALEGVLDALAEAGVFTVAFGGGEPTLHEELPRLAEAARARGLTPVVTTSGVGLTEARARALRGFAQVNVSHDGVDGGYRAVRGFDGAAAADRAIGMLADAGIAVGVNLVLTRESFARVSATADHVRGLGARELQLLRYKPAGRAASVEYLARRLTQAQARGVYPLLGALAERHGTGLSVRIDCALVPFLVPYVNDAAELERWGVMGCEAGRHLGAVTREGAVAPCSFTAGAGAQAATEFVRGVREDRSLARFRAFADGPPEPCASCAIRSVCRGGCKVVSEHVVGAFGPDPECPRVVGG